MVTAADLTLGSLHPVHGPAGIVLGWHPLLPTGTAADRPHPTLLTAAIALVASLQALRRHHLNPPPNRWDNRPDPADDDLQDIPPVPADDDLREDDSWEDDRWDDGWSTAPPEFF